MLTEVTEGRAWWIAAPRSRLFGLIVNNSCHDGQDVLCCQGTRWFVVGSSGRGEVAAAGRSSSAGGLGHAARVACQQGFEDRRYNVG